MICSMALMLRHDLRLAGMGIYSRPISRHACLDLDERDTLAAAFRRQARRPYNKPAISLHTGSITPLGMNGQAWRNIDQLVKRPEARPRIDH